MKKYTYILFLLLLTPLSVSAVKYSEGQTWLYKSRSTDNGSLILINKIESHSKLGKIFHISVSGVVVKNPQLPTGLTTELPHLPVSKETFDKSVTEMKGIKSINSEYLAGYKTWKQAFDNGKAGIFTISIKEIVDFIEQTINK